MSYERDNWIFFENAYLSFDGYTKTILFNEFDEKWIFFKNEIKREIYTHSHSNRC